MIRIVLAAFCVGVLPTWAAEPSEPIVLTLRECIDRALAVSPAVRAAIYDREVAQGKLAEARSAFILPEVKLRVLGGPVPDVPNGSGPEGGFPHVQTDLTELGPFLQVRVDALQPVYTFGKLTAYKRAAEQGVDARTAGEQAAKNELIRQVKKVYYTINFLRSVEDFLTELRERATGARDRVNELLRKHSSDVTDIDLMRLDVFFAETERNAIETRNGIALGMSSLGLLVGGPSHPAVSPVEKGIHLREVAILPLEHYLTQAKSSRPEVRQLDDLVGIKRALADATKADFLPQIFVGGFYNFGIAPDREDVDNPFLKDDFNFNTGGVALGFEQRLAFHLTNSRYGQASAEYQKSVYDRQQAMLGIELEIRRAYSEAISKQDSVRAARDGFKAGRSWVTASTLNFGVGLVPVKDLLEAFVAYSKVKVGFFDTIKDFDFALTELSRAVGEEVDG